MYRAGGAFVRAAALPPRQAASFLFRKFRRWVGCSRNLQGVGRRRRDCYNRVAVEPGEDPTRATPWKDTLLNFAENRKSRKPQEEE